MPSVVCSATPNASTASDLLAQNKKSDCTQYNDQNVLLLQLIDWGTAAKSSTRGVGIIVWQWIYCGHQSNI